MEKIGVLLLKHLVTLPSSLSSIIEECIEASFRRRRRRRHRQLLPHVVFRNRQIRNSKNVIPPPLQIIRLILRVYHPSGRSRRTRNQSHKLVMLQKSFWSNEKNWSKKMSQEKVPDKYKMQCDRIWQNFATLAKC